MDLTALVEEHSRRAAAEGPVTYALLQAMRYLQDGRNFVEGDFREWIAEGERLREEVHPDLLPGLAVVRDEIGSLTTGDDDRPLPEHPERGPDRAFGGVTPAHIPLSAVPELNPASGQPHIMGSAHIPPLTAAQQRMAKARAAKAAKAGAA